MGIALATVTFPVGIGGNGLIGIALAVATTVGFVGSGDTVAGLVAARLVPVTSTAVRATKRKFNVNEVMEGGLLGKDLVKILYRKGNPFEVEHLQQK